MFFGVPCLLWWAPWDLKTENKKMTIENGKNIQTLQEYTLYDSAKSNFEGKVGEWNSGEISGLGFSGCRVFSGGLR